jgi:hypothetical protein
MQYSKSIKIPNIQYNKENILIFYSFHDFFNYKKIFQRIKID